jgi:hypothetical protein
MQEKMVILKYSFHFTTFKQSKKVTSMSHFFQETFAKKLNYVAVQASPCEMVKYYYCCIVLHRKDVSMTIKSITASPFSLLTGTVELFKDTLVKKLMQNKMVIILL